MKCEGMGRAKASAGGPEIRLPRVQRTPVLVSGDLLCLTFLAAVLESSSDLAPVTTILPEAKISAVVLGSRMRMMTAAKRCMGRKISGWKTYHRHEGDKGRGFSYTSYATTQMPTRGHAALTDPQGFGGNMEAGVSINSTDLGVVLGIAGMQGDLLEI